MKINDKTELKTISISELGGALLQFKGVPLSLKGYAPFQAIYNTDAPVVTVRCSRQVG